jgi:hypothetical protein
MIKAEEARQLTGKILEEKYKDQLNIIANHIAKACENGQSSVKIRNANKLFLNRFCFEDVRFVLKNIYKYECYLSSEGTTLSVYWCKNAVQ